MQQSRRKYRLASRSAIVVHRGESSDGLWWMGEEYVMSGCGVDGRREVDASI